MTSPKDLKLLWSRARGQCSFPGCGIDLTATLPKAGEVILGDMAHVVAKSAGGPRATIDRDDSYANLILLCPNHHRLVDLAPDDYDVATLLEWKRHHESTPLPRGLSPEALMLTCNTEELVRSTKLRSRLVAVGCAADVARPEVIASLIAHALDGIQADVWIEGNAAGGWGKSYGPRYYNDLFGSTESGTSKNSHSITFTLWVLEGLLPFLDTDVAKPIRDEVLERIEQYFLRHYDPSTGGVGPRWIGPDSGEQIASNIRHACAALLAFDKLPSCFRQLQRTADYILADVGLQRNWSEARGLSLSAVLRALYTIRNSDILRRGLRIEPHELAQMVSHLELELASKYRNGRWGGKENKDPRTKHWYSAFILRSLLPDIQTTETGGLRHAYGDSLANLVGSLTTAESGRGMPYLPGELPDIGMTGVLLDIILQDRTLPAAQRKDLMTDMLTFLLGCHENSLYQKFTYSWTWAMVLRALLLI